MGDNKQFENPINGLWGIKNINGNIYGATYPRRIYKRIDVDNWKKIGELSNLFGARQNGDVGFETLDGFSENDLYAVGGDRDVWHFDGKNWRPIDISEQKFICTCVVCADDGYVYIGGENGAIARGRGDDWQTDFPDDGNDFTCIVSYRNRIFAGTENSLFVIRENLKPEVYDFEGQLPEMASQYLYTAYDRLLVANDCNQVAFFNGEKWLDINECHE